MHETARTHSLNPRRALAGLLFTVVLLTALYAVAFDGTLHELLHDGRHLLGFPCH
jgi:hypothetical protein